MARESDRPARVPARSDDVRSTNGTHDGSSVPFGQQRGDEAAAAPCRCDVNPQRRPGQRGAVLLYRRLAARERHCCLEPRRGRRGRPRGIGFGWFRRLQLGNVPPTSGLATAPAWRASTSARSHSPLALTAGATVHTRDGPCVRVDRREHLALGHRHHAVRGKPFRADEQRGPGQPAHRPQAYSVAASSSRRRFRPGRRPSRQPHHGKHGAPPVRHLVRRLRFRRAPLQGTHGDTSDPGSIC